MFILNLNRKAMKNHPVKTSFVTCLCAVLCVTAAFAGNSDSVAIKRYLHIRQLDVNKDLAEIDRKQDSIKLFRQQCAADIAGSCEGLQRAKDKLEMLHVILTADKHLLMALHRENISMWKQKVKAQTRVVRTAAEHTAGQPVNVAEARAELSVMIAELEHAREERDKSRRVFIKRKSDAGDGFLHSASGNI